MSASKHTPGPWVWINSVTDEPFDFDAEWDGCGNPSLRTEEYFGENKTEIRDGESRTSYSLPKWILDAEPMQNGNDAANARLIAAAPDQHDALMQWKRAEETGDETELANARIARDVAIAKATATGA